MQSTSKVGEIGASKHSGNFDDAYAITFFSVTISKLGLAKVILLRVFYLFNA